CSPSNSAGVPSSTGTGSPSCYGPFCCSVRAFFARSSRVRRGQCRSLLLCLRDRLVGTHGVQRDAPWPDVLVVVEHIVRVVLGLDVGEPLVGVAVGFANPAVVVVGVEEVDVDAGAVGLECVEESLGPSDLGCADGVALVREPYG